ncbi:homocysteine S-methyltransferase family protein [candidate division KSB1 bacterium]|nr:homocysteine S-methyltransferase family protein [candidate division KSB1 bacterium]
MRPDFMKTINEKVLLIDGAMGTMLQSAGLPVGEASEKWNLEQPDIVEEIQRKYVDAGSDIILTNSFGGSYFKLDANGLGAQTAKINKSAAQIARRAAGESVYVAGSIGPTGQFLEPLGTVSTDKMEDVFELQIEALIEGGIDVVCIETMSDPHEAACAVRAAKKLAHIPVIASMTYDSGKAGFRTMMGNDVASCAKILSDAGADVLSTNCGLGIDQMIGIVKEMRAASNLPLMAEPNAGLPELVGGKTVFRETAEMMSGKLLNLVKAGLSIVGGCCGTSPEYIKRFRAVVDAFNKTNRE